MAKINQEVICSFILPVFNCENTIGRCLQSIQNQDISNEYDYEIIVINDGSTDGTLGIVLSFAETNDKIKVITQKNKGVSAARNAGICVARGRYVFFIDADDYLIRGAFKSCLGMMVANDLDALKIGIMRVGCDESELHDEFKEEIWSTNVFTGAQWLIKDKGWHRAPWQYIHKRTNITDHDVWFDEKVIIAEDSLFDTEALFYAKRMSELRSPAYVYIVNPNSASHKRRWFDEAFDIGINNAWGHKRLADRLNENKGLREIKDVLYTLERTRDYYVFSYCLWPMIKDAIPYAKASVCLRRLRDAGIFPVKAPVKGYITMHHAKPLHILWHISRIPVLFRLAVVVRRFLSLCKLT